MRDHEDQQQQPIVNMTIEDFLEEDEQDEDEEQDEEQRLARKDELLKYF